MKRIRLLVIDDHPLICSAIASGAVALRKSSIEYVGCAYTGEKGIEESVRLRPDVILLDLTLTPEMNGLQTARRILEVLPSAKIVYLSMHDEPEWTRGWAESGAVGYIHKGVNPALIFDAVENAFRGVMTASPAIVRSMARASKLSTRETLLRSLTPREECVLRYIASGCESKQIAGRLDISIRTVGRHRENLMNKLNLHSIADLTRFAISCGLTEPE
jgi:DNA-binding NarL/FixJ family response regulator